MTIKQIRALIEAKLKEMRAISDSAIDGEKIRSLTEEENSKYSELESEVKTLRAQLERALELDEAEAEIRSLDEDEEPKTRVSVTRAENHDEKGEYRGFKSIGEQLQVVRSAAVNPARMDKRLAEVRAAAGLNEGNDSEGGFLLQSDFISSLETSVMKNANLAQFCARIPVGPNANGTSEPYLDETSRANGSRHGGAQAYWENEAATLQNSKPSFDNLELKLKKLTAKCVVTDEMLADSTQLGGFVSEVFSEEMGFKTDAAIIEGSGAGEPLGVLNSNAMVEVAKESGQAADTIVAGNALKMFAAMHTRGKSRAVWVVNPEGYAQLPAMTIGDQPVWLPQGGLMGLEYPTLLGRPVIESEICKKLGDSGDFLLLDLGMYRLIEKQGLEKAQSIHVHFNTAETAFRFIRRMNGAPRIKSSITPYNANTNFKVSAFVKVANRA